MKVIHFIEFFFQISSFTRDFLIWKSKQIEQSESRPLTTSEVCEKKTEKQCFIHVFFCFINE